MYEKIFNFFLFLIGFGLIAAISIPLVIVAKICGASTVGLWIAGLGPTVLLFGTYWIRQAYKKYKRWQRDI